jgi:hypothetical protein
MYIARRYLSFAKIHSANKGLYNLLHRIVITLAMDAVIVIAKFK